MTILAIILVPVFCFWGVGSVLRGRKKTASVGKVFGKSISVQEYIKNYRAVRNQLIIQLGEEQLAKLEKYLNLEGQAWDRIVLLTEAKRRKIRINNEEVVDFIKQYPFFQSEGKFIPKLYQEMVMYVFRTNPREFEEEIRDNLAISQLYQSVTEDITINDEEIRKAYNKEHEQISLNYVYVSAEDFLDEVSVQEPELLDYYNKNSEQFKKSLSYNLEYIKADSKVSSKDNQTVSKIAQLLNQGFDLADAAKDTGLEIKETGLFRIDEPIPQIGWSTEILRILPKLKPKGKPWLQPIQVEVNVAYFIKLKEKKQPYIPPFNEVKDEVTQRLHKHKASQIAKEKLEACQEETKISSLFKAAEKFNLKTGTTELFKRRSYVEGLGSSDVFFEAVQNLAEDQISQTINTSSGFYIAKVKERVAPDEETFKQEKEDFAKNLLNQKKHDYFAQFITELKNKPKTFMLATE